MRKKNTFIDRRACRYTILLTAFKRTRALEKYFSRMAGIHKQASYEYIIIQDRRMAYGMDVIRCNVARYKNTEYKLRVKRRVECILRIHIDYTWRAIVQEIDRFWSTRVSRL